MLVCPVKILNDSVGEIAGIALPSFSAVSKHLLIVSILTKGLTPSWMATIPELFTNLSPFLTE